MKEIDNEPFDNSETDGGENAPESGAEKYTEEDVIPLSVSDIETEDIEDDFALPEDGMLFDGAYCDDEDDDFDADDNGDTYADIEPEDDFLAAADEEPDNGGNDNENGAKRGMSKSLKIFLAVIIIIAAAAAGFYAWGILSAPKTVIMRNTYIEDINVGGKTYDEAAELMASSNLLNDQVITLVSGESTYTINGSEIGITPNLADTVSNAFNYGKTSNAFVNGFLNIKSLFAKTTIIPAGAIDSSLLAEKINEFGVSLHGELANHYVEINTEDFTAVIWPGHSGYNPYDENSYAAAEQTVIEYLNNSSYYNIPVELPVSAPAELTLEAFDAAGYAESSDAYFAVENNEVTIVPEQNGRYIDKEEAAAILPQVTEGGDAVKIPYYILYPDITAEQLGAKLFNSTLASYSTSYGGSTENRKANVARAAELINGTVIAAGETFSFNDTVGNRTVENGFYTATEYVNGESVEGIGGGTCQVSTTLYSAVLYADLGIVSRTNHEMTVGYVPLGQDATVAYGGIDFKFKNTSDYPIKIKTTADGTTITVSIIGTAWEPERTVEIKHSTTTEGEDTIVESTRYVYENGVLMSTDPLGKSRYKPHKETED
ncbi:MAG: VanW family protein [Firmicutes bacterium]|nr:VanW family protein [Bacillota bacterium]